MGEGYRAKDQKLGCDVAIKVLPEEFAKDEDAAIAIHVAGLLQEKSREYIPNPYSFAKNCKLHDPNAGGISHYWPRAGKQIKFLHRE